MLVLSRKKNERTVITVPPSNKPQQIVITTVDIRGDKVRTGYDADEAVTIHRGEVQEAIERERREADGIKPTEAA